MEEIYALIISSELILEDLRNHLLKEFTISNDRTKIALSDIERVIQHSKYYSNDMRNYKPNEFKFHNDLVFLVDTIKENDFGVSLSSESYHLQNEYCDKILALIDSLIKVNNRNKM